MFSERNIIKLKLYYLNTYNAHYRLDPRNINLGNTWCLFQKAHSGDKHKGKQYKIIDTPVELV